MYLLWMIKGFVWDLGSNPGKLTSVLTVDVDLRHRTQGKDVDRTRTGEGNDILTCVPEVRSRPSFSLGPKAGTHPKYGHC